MLENNDYGRTIIAARAGKGFSKAHIKNIFVADLRILNPKRDIKEHDYYFEYKGDYYRINQHLVVEPSNDKLIAASYDLIKLQEA